MSFDDAFFKLQQSQERLAFALQSARMGTWDIDLAQGIVNCSPEMLQLWGVDPTTFNGDRHFLQSKVHPDDLQPMQKAIDQAIANESIYEMSYRIFPSPGVLRWVFSRGRCTYAPGSHRPVRFSGVVFDITESKQKDEALKNAQKMREDFFQMAGHELRTPLAILQLQLQVAEWDLQNSPSGALGQERLNLFIKKQKEQLQRLTRIVNNILDESSIASDKLTMQIETFDLSEMVRDVANQMKNSPLAERCEMRLLHLEQTMGSWDRFRLEQVLINLMTNALKYGENKPVELEVRQTPSMAQLVIRDQGIGIRKEDHERIFEHSVRIGMNPDSNGLGLGLFISNSIVRMHGGKIAVKSEVGKGSEFIVTLPKQSSWSIL